MSNWLNMEYIYTTKGRCLLMNLSLYFQEYYELISSGKEVVKLIYKSQLSEEDFSKSTTEFITERTGSSNILLLGFIKMIWPSR